MVDMGVDRRRVGKMEVEQREGMNKNKELLS